MTNRNAVRRLSRFGDVADGRASFHKFQEFTTSMEFSFSLSLRFRIVLFYSLRKDRSIIGRERRNDGRFLLELIVVRLLDPFRIE